MSDDSQRSYDLYEKIAPILNNLQAINSNFDSQKKQIQNLTYTVDKLHLQTKNKEMDEKNLQWLYSLQGRENKLAQEIQLNESKKAQIESLKQQELFYQEQIQSLTIDNNKLRQQLLNVQQKNEQLISQSETQLKQSIREVNEQFISRLTQLESQLQMKQRDETNTIVQMQQMNNKMKVLESQKQIFKEECEQFEQIKQTLEKEKEMYLSEFRYLKENYFKTIDKLQEEVHKLKVQNHSLSEDNKSLKQTCDYYKGRFQDMMDLHELATLNADQSLIGLLKQKGMENVSKMDLQQVRDELVTEMTIQKGFQLNSAWDQVISDINNIN